MTSSALGGSNRAALLPGLDAIRGLAALGVVLDHLEQSRLFFGVSTLWPLFNERRLGALSVTLFFVLSGFLITHLLLAEESATGRISFKLFYVRRILRIWPLYYLLTVAGFFIIPYVGILSIPGSASSISSFWHQLALYLFLSPHVAQSFYQPVPYSAVLWSVGVEEWFYLFWPFFLVLPRKLLVVALAIIIIGLTVCRWYFVGGTPFYFFSQVRFDCMAVGGAAALAWRYDGLSLVRRVIPVLLSPPGWLFACSAVLVCFAFGIRFGIFDDLVYSILYVVIIMNAAVKGRGSKVLEMKWLRYLGRVSYGAYCFNWITVVLALVLSRAVAPELTGLQEHVLHFVLATALTLFAASISYRYFERPFLRLKDQSFSPPRKIISASSPSTPEFYHLSSSISGVADR